MIDPTRGANGTVVWRWDLAGEAFGNDKPNEDPDGDNVAFVLDMRYPGQQYDSASGLNYNYFRNYEASAGRYVESDPIGLRGGVSTYGYVRGNPLTRIDPFGLTDEAGKVPDSCELSGNCALDKKRFDSIDDAARTMLQATYVRSSQVDIEVCGLICRDRSSGKFFLADTTSGTGTTCRPGYRQCPACSSQAGWWHTHGAPESFLFPYRAEIFSPEDMRISNETALTGFLGTPDGNFVRYTPGDRRPTYGWFMKLIIASMLFPSLLFCMGCTKDHGVEDRQPIVDAVNSSVKYARADAVDLSEYTVRSATEFGNAYTSIIERSSNNQYDVEVLQKLYRKRYWEICYSHASPEVAGAMYCYYIDKNLNLLAAYRMK